MPQHRFAIGGLHALDKLAELGGELGGELAIGAEHEVIGFKAAHVAFFNCRAQFTHHCLVAIVQHGDCQLPEPGLRGQAIGLLGFLRGRAKIHQHLQLQALQLLQVVVAGVAQGAGTVQPAPAHLPVIPPCGSPRDRGSWQCRRN